MMKRLLPKFLFFTIGLLFYFRRSKWLLSHLLSIRNKPIILVYLITSYTIYAQNGINQTFDTFKSGGIAAKSIKPFILNTNETLAGNFFQDNYSPTFLDLSQKVIQQVDSSTHFLTLTIPIKADKSLELELFTVNIFAPNFKVLNSTNQEIPISKGLYYHGRIKGNENSIAAVSFINGEVFGMVSDSTGNRTLKKYSTGNVYSFYYENAVNANGQTPFKCDIPEKVATTSPQNPTTEAVVGCKVVNIYIEGDYQLFLTRGSSVSATTDYITGIFNQVSVLYRNENLAIQISAIKVWNTSDPYTGTTTSVLLDQIRLALGTSFNGNLAHLFSGKNLGGGIAYINVLCNKSYGFGVNAMSFGGYFNGGFTTSPVGEIAHEIGHNFGSEHTHACVWNGNNTPIDNCYTPEGGCSPGPAPVNGGTIMSYCHLLYGTQTYYANGFGTQPGNLIRAKVTACNQLTVNNAVPTSSTTSDITTTTATVAWTIPTTSTNFTVRYRTVGSGTWLTSTTASFSKVLTGLLSGTQYEWQVTGDCSNGVYTSLSTFTTVNECSSIPVTGLQTLFIAGTSADLKWTVGYVTPYTIEYRKAGESIWQSTTTVENAISIYSLSMNTNYEWRVKTRCSSFSDISTFKTYPTLGDISYPKFLFCPGQSTTISLPIDGNQYIPYENVGTVELSNASGSFDFPTIIGYLNGYNGGDINITILGNTPVGTKYRMRIIMTDPSLIKNSAYDVEIGAVAPIIQTVTSCPNSPSTVWEKAYGGIESEELRSSAPAADGGMVLFGSSNSPGNGGNTGISDKAANNRGGWDYWAVKIDENKNKVWDAGFGGTGNDYGRIIIPTKDGGYLIGGFSSSDIGGEKTYDNVGFNDYWIVKISSNGYKIWDKRFGGTGNDELTSMLQTGDGGYLLAGRSNSPANGSKTKPNHNGSYDYWIIKIDANGIRADDWVFGGNNDETLTSIIATSDGGYLVGGHSLSDSDGDKTEASWFNTSDYWLVKVDMNFNKLWDKRYGGGGGETMAYQGLIETSDGNFVIAGSSDSNVTGDKTEASWFDTRDYWILKINSQNRSIIKQHRFGGGADDGCSAILATPDGGYLIGGSSTSNVTGNKTEPTYVDSYDYWTIKVDGNLEKVWDKDYRGGGIDFVSLIASTPDGKFLLGGSSTSQSAGDKSELSRGSYDFWFIKFSDCQTSSSTTVNIGQKAFLSATGCLGNVTWSNGAVGNRIFVKPTVNTTYTATCFYGCTSANSSAINITVTPCPTTYTLTSPNDDYINAPTTLKAKASTGSLNATNKISGTSNVLYEGNKIMLNPGFETTQGTIFKAQIGGCN